MTSAKEIAKKLLIARGISADDEYSFYNPSVQQLVQAETIPGVPLAVKVILEAISKQAKIVVFGDYDCDGVCAAAILVTTLRKLGADADAILPDRFSEGYGLTRPAIERLFREYPKVGLVVTVDNGITAVDEIASIRAKGVKVVVTDHHLPLEKIPEADALVETKIAACPGCENLCGAGIAFFLCCALIKEAEACGLYVDTGERFSGPLLVMAGLATVTDLMPLLAQNRILVSQAIKLFHKDAPIGLRELLLLTFPPGTVHREDEITSRTFAFALGPRINAAGRMDKAITAYDLLMAPPASGQDAQKLAKCVNLYNEERKDKEKEVTDAVCARVGEEPKKLGAVVAYDEAWHTGVAGIVAARLVEKYTCPVAIAAGDHGSVRAPVGYDVHAILAASSPALSRWGGHAAAGGFSLKAGCFEDFKRLFSQACLNQAREHAAAIAKARSPEPDLWIEPSDISMELLEEVERFRPFGEGNPEPVFGLCKVRFATARCIGINNRHGSFTFVNPVIPHAVWWNKGDEAGFISASLAWDYDILFCLFRSSFGSDTPHPELRIVNVVKHKNEV